MCCKLPNVDNFSKRMLFRFCELDVVCNFSELGELDELGKFGKVDKVNAFSHVSKVVNVNKLIDTYID